MRQAIQKHINSQQIDGPFMVADPTMVISQHEKWMKNLPRFKPHYAVKCNDEQFVLDTLHSLDTGYDCASASEIKTILEMGVPPSKIIFANPCKSPEFIKFAADNGVDRMTFDNEHELLKIKEIHPNAKLVIRIRVDDSSSICQFGIKFGVHAERTKQMLETAKELNLDVIGVSFHVGSGCLDANSYDGAIKSARNVFDEAKEVGYDFTLLDIGGGFPGLGAQNGYPIKFESFAEVINDAVDKYFPNEDGIEFIAEPGRFFASQALTLVAGIHSKRATISGKDGETSSNMYYLNDGVYGSFNSIIYDHAVVSAPEFLLKTEMGDFEYKLKEEIEDREEFESSIWGPTCDSVDLITKSIKLPDLDIGEGLVFENMGAYTNVAWSNFNGMKNADIVYLNSAVTPPLIEKEFKPVFLKPRKVVTKEYS